MKRALSIAALTAALFAGLLGSAQAAPGAQHKHVSAHKAHAPAKALVRQHAQAHRQADARKYKTPQRPRRTFAHWTPNLKAKKYHSFGSARYYEGNYYVSAYTHKGLPVKLMVNAITGAILHANVHSIGAHR